MFKKKYQYISLKKSQLVDCDGNAVTLSCHDIVMHIETKEVFEVTAVWETGFNIIHYGKNDVYISPYDEFRIVGFIPTSGIQPQPKIEYIEYLTYLE